MDRSSARASSSANVGRKPWVAPRLHDHGSLRTFVRNISGTFDDGKAPPQGQGAQMESMNPGGGD